jgi:murein DD-endopeptidase MepM/ murein hydrolase activator NlpD
MRLSGRAHAGLVLLIAGIGTSSTLLLVRGVPVQATAAPGNDEAMVRAFDARLSMLANDEARASRSAAAPAEPAAVPPVPPAPTYVWPADGAITGPFGERRGRSRHPGLDIDGEVGDPVRVAASGVVLWAGPAPIGLAGYGNVVVIDTGGGVVTLYAHLSSWALTTGQSAATGERLGAIGTSGHVTGSHLHFELRVANVPVDPAKWLPPR